MPHRQITVSGLPAIALSNDEIEVVCVPGLGGKLTNLRRRGGREWLWRNPAIPLRPPDWGASYVETADSGGWDECFPTIGPSPMPGARPDEPLLPDHGELWALPWEHAIVDRPEGVTLIGTVEGKLLPYDLHREITLAVDRPEVRITYVLRHRGEVPFPFIWAGHPLINVQAGSTITLPTVEQAYVISVAGREDVAVGDTVPWPLEGAGAAWSFPGNAGWALMLGADLGASGRMEVTDPVRGERLEIDASPEVGQVGVWINAGGWAPATLEGRPGPTPYVNLGLEPCIGAPDALERATERWRAAAMLAPGEARRWALTIRIPDPLGD
ncbi:MAG: hypothetical protein WBC97_01760 [Gemmatimonadales bacterium]